ncbi:MAG: AAA family ATPase [Candidatus Omnitrophota bacterium]|nr:AAA family ATPase [Candidatus Omnitrophota bacterium]
MYEEYWNLAESPFENTPDSRFLYYSREHEEGLSRLLYAVERRKGAAMLTGVFGCGKTVLGRALLTRLNKNVYQIALINNPHLKSIELLRSIARQLGVENLPEKLTEMSADHFLQVIEEILLNNVKDGKETLIVIDEAHVITDNDIFEELRLLLNFQFEDRFLLTLILMGQPELAERIRKNKQFSQRIAIGYNLGPLSQIETENYIEHRLKVAGVQKQIFNPQSVKPIFQNSGGIPRRINKICDMCLMIGFNYEIRTIDEAIVKEVADNFGV